MMLERSEVLPTAVQRTLNELTNLWKNICDGLFQVCIKADPDCRELCNETRSHHTHYPHPIICAQKHSNVNIVQNCMYPHMWSLHLSAVIGERD